MFVLGLEFARRDSVDVDVEGPRRGGMEPGLESGFLRHFPTGHVLARALARFSVASGLKPEMELGVMEKQNRGTVFRHDQPGAGEMPLLDAAIEGIGMPPGKLQHTHAIALFARFRSPVGGQRGGHHHRFHCRRFENRCLDGRLNIMSTDESLFYGVSFSRTDKSIRRFSRQELDRELLDESVFSWIDVQGGDIGDLNDLLLKLELNLRLVSHFDDPEILPRIVERAESLAFYLYEVEDPERHLDTNRGISEIELDRMILVLSTEYVITYHRRQMDVVDSVKASCEDAFRLAGKSPAFIAFLFIERCLYDCAHLNLANDNALDILDSRLVLGDSESAQEGLREVAGNILTLKKLAASLHIVLMLLGTKRSRFISDEAKVAFQEVLGNALAVRGAVDSSRDLLDGVLASIQAASANKTNEVMRVLTVMSGILLPLSLIAGIYGMNFENMPELRHPLGYTGVLAFMAVLGLALYTGFRRAGFIGRPK